MLGDEADQFATPNDRHKASATVENDDEDLLGGGGGGDGATDADVTGFESSFPAIDTSNEVRSHGS